ncbi:hypothetical protein FQN54_004049 [Arachnomyces sp. PD_36]|nr:hypothetical protein FQN54_004049 [Arachnomyces sp. PD_36]
MTLATDQAGSVVRSWLASCWSCVWPQNPDDQRLGQTQSREAQREMKICHTQPHLVPPMKLVFYDDLPSPGVAPQSSNLSHWVAEGRNLASKASNRASINTLWRRPSRKPTISKPSDFRRVDPPAARLDTTFRPLELSIYRPGNHLGELPTFGDFDLEDLEEPKPPPRALSPGARHSSQPSFSLPRKPVGSAPRPSSAFVGASSAKNYHTMPQRQRPATDPYMSPTAPQRTKSEANPPIRRVRSKSEPSLPPSPGKSNRSQSVDHTFAPQDGLFKETLGTEDKQSDPSTPPDTPNTRNSLLSYRVARWLFPSSPSTPPSPPNRASDQTLSSRLSQFWASPNGQPAVLHKRNRTLSGSTITSSSLMSTNGGGGHGRNFSLSSGATATTLHQHPSLEIVLDKEIESGNYPLPINTSRKASVSQARFQEACPTVYEGEQQLGQDFRPDQHRQSAVGLAF